MKFTRFLLPLLVLLTPLGAQVPQLLNYQGRISTAGVPFDGTGQFKFALVNANGSTVHWGNSPDIAPVDGVPDQSVQIAVSKGLYAVLLGDPAIPNMAVLPNGVFQNTDVRLRVWFNDGSQGMQLLTPDQRISSAGFAFMAGNVPDGAITTAKLAPGSVGTNQLAAGAVTAGKLAANTITGSNLVVGAVSADKLAAGAASANLTAAGQSAVAAGGVILSTNPYDPAMAAAGYVKLGSTTVADSWDKRDAYSAPLGTIRSSHSAVWTGSEMILWGGWTNIGAVATGWRYNPAANTWTPTDLLQAPSARSEHTAVWTGTEMIVWGGWTGSAQIGTGSRYNPVTNTWAEVATAGALTMQRSGHSAVWTGTEMIIWGGYNGSQVTSIGGRYDPTAGPVGSTGAPVGTWRQVPSTGAPSARMEHTAVWTGTEMIIWGGNSFTFPIDLNDGARFNPSTGPPDPIDGLPVGTWTPVSMVNTPPGRYAHTAVWSGSEMIVWGGIYGGNSGGRYSPATDSWTSTPLTGAPAGHQAHTAIWSGTEMIVWGGYTGNQNARSDGGRYDPSNGPQGTWTVVPSNPSIGPRWDHSAIWTGTEMIVWGGSNAADGGRYSPTTGTWTVLSTPPTGRIDHSTIWTGAEMIVWSGGGVGGPPYADGARYNPALDTWRRISTTGAPAARREHTAVWTGSEMVVWGGWDGSVYFNSGGRYNPTTDAWLATPLTGAPSARRRHTAVWTGSEMIVWGGSVSASYPQFGGRFNPATGLWNSMNGDDAPVARHQHVATWTGSEMIVWGGYNGTQLGDGARYDPVENSWTSCSTISAPSPRENPTVVWTGSEMIIWGGYHSVNPFTNTGGRYLPTGGGTDPNTGKPLGVWTPVSTAGAPYQREEHSAVWTGRFMVIWGAGGVINPDHALYEPSANAWTPVTSESAPTSRGGHSAVWTGSTMIVWGGSLGGTVYSDTYGYNPPRQMFLYQKP